MSTIRIKETTDEDINEMGKEDVIKKIRSVREYQSKTKPSGLYSRSWEDVSNNHSNERNDEDSFTVMQFNALAEGLSSGPSKLTHFHSTMSTKNEYGGFTEVPHRDLCIDFSYRKWRLLEVIIEANFPDILGLEELDNYHNFFKPILELFGYVSIFEPKPNAPGVKLGWYSDGCALFWKSDVFEKVYHESQPFQDAQTRFNQVFIKAKLRHKVSQNSIIVTVTHLKAGTGEINESIRMKELQILISSLKASKNNQNIPILILGDFNCEPDSTCVCNFETQMALVSAYSHAKYHQDHSNYTTYKIRGSKETKRVVDYIFFNPKSIECTNILSIPHTNALEKSKLPGFCFPSDHINIAAKFNFLPY